LKFLPGSVCFLAAMFLAGCASVGKKTTFYTLSIPSEVQATESYLGHPAKPIFIDVMPVIVPERLARPQLVVNIKDKENQLLILEQARWSSHFHYELRDAFAAHIARKIGGQIEIREIRGIQAHREPIYRIAIRLSQFDATLGGRVSAKFDWTIAHSTQARSAACYSVVSATAGPDIESLVKGIGSVVAAASERIAETLVEMNESGEATCRSQEK
jgi:uncharacterized lipoprotein YmbA